MSYQSSDDSVMNIVQEEQEEIEEILDIENYLKVTLEDVNTFPVSFSFNKEKKNWCPDFFSKCCPEKQPENRIENGVFFDDDELNSEYEESGCCQKKLDFDENQGAGCCPTSGEEISLTGEDKRRCVMF